MIAQRFPAGLFLTAAVLLAPGLARGAEAAPAAKAEPPKAAAKPAAKPADPYAWQKMFDGTSLDGWKSPEFGGEGEVKVRDGAINLAMGNSMTGVTYTETFPKINYELKLEGKRITGNDFFCTTTFPVGETCCSFVVGGWGGPVVGLSTVDFYDASDNVTTQFGDFKTGQWYKVRIRVSTTKIECWIDSEKMVNLTTAGRKISIRDECDLCRPLGVSSWCTEAGLRNIEYRQLKPEEVAEIAKEAALEDGDNPPPAKKPDEKK